MDNLILLVALLGGMAGLLWSARRYDVATKRYQAQLSLSEQQQNRTQELLNRQDAQQAQLAQIYDRQEAILARIEALLDQFENRNRGG